MKLSIIMMAYNQSQYINETIKAVVSKDLPEKSGKNIVGDTNFNIIKYYLYQKNKSKAIRHLMTSIFYQKKHAQLKHKLYNLLLNKKIPEYN